ncbi:hypothetical protein GSI_10784 [Ganoderma sinense ZZ0214-1]|uniref:DUF4048 domain-containing protein n=1 Tax=Ganoderma sinense ZZ0214-1 TaxID=1077348 RepID=A0A2G8S1I5_9APHY|nr:hypothetical protein GSI_10784 [Ganoderma sinense ZZ0214-1]
MSSPVPPSPSPGPRPLQLVDGNVQSPTDSSFPPTPVSGLSTPPPSARKFNARRQSSISYYPSDHTPSWDLRSPTTAGPGPSSLRRSTSLNQKIPARLDLKGDRRSLPQSGVEAVEGPLTDRPPLTLTEKHADLLRFIAQKESKCLELRSQLAVHEAELAQLKRKWERIVSRGMDRAYSQQPSTPSLAPSSILTDAVKDVSRLLAAGLDLSSPSPTSSPGPPKSSKLPGHANTQSTSSVATSATSASRAATSSSVRLSQSSASSFAHDDAPCEEDERPAALSNHSSSSGSPTSVRRASVRVDGGTGIESPVEISSASALRAAKLHRRKSRDAPPPSAYHRAGTPEVDVKGKGTGGAGEDANATVRASKRASQPAGSGGAGLPPAASIPGLGASAWMGSVGSSVGKKWGEIQKGETFTKSQKRASLLISDAASSLFAAFTSTSPTALASATPSVASVTSNPFGPSLSPVSPSSAAPKSSPAPSSVSLLEEDDDVSALGSVLVPDNKGPLLTATFSRALPPRLDDDDEWNW